MSNMKKVAVSASAAALAGLMMIGGASIMAYLTDEEKSTNTFTVGRVNTDLAEPNYPGNDSDKVKNLIPGKEVEKDPRSINTGENDIISYIAYDIPVVWAITSDIADGHRENDGNPHAIELFKTKAAKQLSVHNSMTDGVFDGTPTTTDANVEVADNKENELGEKFALGDWVPLDQVRYVKVTKTLNADGTVKEGSTTTTYLDKELDYSGSDAAKNFVATDFPEDKVLANGETEITRIYARRIYGYSNVVAGTTAENHEKEDRTTKPIFEKVKMANIIEDQVPAGKDEDIIVYNFAIQAANVSDITSENLKAGDKVLKEGVTGDEAVNNKNTLTDVFKVYFNQQDLDGKDGENTVNFDLSKDHITRADIDSAEAASSLNLHGDPGAGEEWHEIIFYPGPNAGADQTKLDQVGYIGADGALTFSVRIRDNQATNWRIPGDNDNVIVYADVLEADGTASSNANAVTIEKLTGSNAGDYKITGNANAIDKQIKIVAKYRVPKKSDGTFAEGAEYNQATGVLDVLFYDNDAKGKTYAENQHRIPQTETESPNYVQDSSGTVPTAPNP